MLIAIADGYVIGWHLARTESAFRHGRHSCFRIPPPQDGRQPMALPAFPRRRKPSGRATRIQRCTFHVASQVKRCTTLKAQAGSRDRALRASPTSSRRQKMPEQPPHGFWSTAHGAQDGSPFLKEFTFKDGKKVYTHERLRKARRILNKLVRKRHVVRLCRNGPRAWRCVAFHRRRRRERKRPSSETCCATHRGLPLLHRVKADFLVVLHAHRKPASRSRGSFASCRRTTTLMACMHPASEGSKRQDEGWPERVWHGQSFGRSFTCPRITGGK